MVVSSIPGRFRANVDDRLREALAETTDEVAAIAGVGGVISRRSGRYEKQLREDMDDGWGSLESLEPLKTNIISKDRAASSP